MGGREGGGGGSNVRTGGHSAAAELYLNNHLERGGWGGGGDSIIWWWGSSFSPFIQSGTTKFPLLTYIVPSLKGAIVGYLNDPPLCSKLLATGVRGR